MSEIIEYQQPLTAVAIRAQVNLVQEVMKAVMKEGTHYGTIPGTPKPSLWKPGAEVLATTFRIAVSYVSEDLSTADAIRYRVTATGTHQTTGFVMGAGMGECSSGEEKYKWRKASSNKEYDATAEDRRRIKYGYDKKKGQEYEIRQVRTEPADLANTILKMACKRAQVAMTLNVTAASDCFTQDLEDIPEELLDKATGEIHKKEIPPLSDEEFAKQKPKWQAAVVTGKKTPQAIIAWVNAQNLATLTKDQIAEILSWPAPKPAEAKPAENMDAEPVVKAPAIDPDDHPFD